MKKTIWSKRWLACFLMITMVVGLFPLPTLTESAFGAIPGQSQITDNLKPVAPTGLTAVGGNAKVSLTWNTVDGAISYNVKRSTSAGGPYQVSASGLTDPAYTDEAVVNGTMYYYVVTAVNLLGEGAASEEAGAEPKVPPAKIPGFPGAEGAGMYTTGGRGGSVYYVTNLNDSGPGSLRDGISQSNRMILFNVSGVIHLKSRLIIAGSNLTIAGQSAPGDGITVADGETVIGGSNVIVRYIRFRPGDQNIANEPDSFGGRFIHDILVDHVSASWSTDEVLSFYSNVRTTVQWSIISESLTMSGHDKGKHGYGGIWGGASATFHHNLIAHNTSRNPRIGAGTAPQPATVDLRNNVIYDWGYLPTYGGDGSQINMVNNYYKPGPGTYASVRKLFASADTGSWYVAGNVMDGSEEVTANNELGVRVNGGSLSPTEFSVPDGSVATEAGKDAYTSVLAKAGAILPKRDPVDARVVNDVRNGTGRFINRATEVGGYPEMNSAPAPVDSDGDGMPDVWEDEHGLNKNDNSDGSALEKGGSGYTNVEMYLHSLVDWTNAPKNPSVALTSLSLNELHLTGSSLTLQTTATAHAAASIAKVEFYDGVVKLGEAKDAPYSFVWTNLSGGTHYVSARAIDSNGLSTQSSIIPIHVNDAALNAESAWKSVDIGNPPIAGTASVDANNVYTVKGSGVISGSRDSFQFTNQLLKGDGERIVKVESITPVDQYAASGIMIRNTLDPDSAMVMISTSYVKSDTQPTKYSVHLISRGQKGGVTTTPARPTAVLAATNIPVWLKLNRTGNVFTAYASQDGQTWTQVGLPLTIGMNPDVYIGIAVDAKQESNELHNYNAVKVSNVSLTFQNTPPVTTVTSYSDGQYINVSNPTITWSFSDADAGDAQRAYQVQGSKDNWQTTRGSGRWRDVVPYPAISQGSKTLLKFASRVKGIPTASGEEYSTSP
ncbi:hypothetical protein QFZ77_000213 [Paenibacillus sp. V4I3]|uniref:Ig-like domain-containing protein n=1 Tax=Paenibacillus sp. V4I3 TaxID=3042305 RepID=UPI002783C70F|nr:Ig-like domain-containing protein [Paenibacillus sp. V4I3]MDQ0871554.1 hypothetical protein [Paenibacillus sp. V4I3]